MTNPTLVSIQVSPPRSFGTPGATDPLDRPWTTGFYKVSVVGPVRVGRLNIDGDGQADLVNHGGPDKAVCVYPADHYPFWRHDLGLADLPFGAFGENFTVAGLTEGGVCIGDVWAVGEAVIQVSQPRQPCWKLARRWRVKDLALRVQQTGRTGWYFRVLHEGQVEPGCHLRLTDRPLPEWTVERANRVMHHLKDDIEQATALAALPLLSASWRSSLRLRADKHDTQADVEQRLSGPGSGET